MKLRIWSLFAVGATLAVIALYKMIPPLTRPGDFTEFGAGFMFGNGMLLLAGVIMMVIAWRRRTQA